MNKSGAGNNCQHEYVVGVMKMGNIAPRAGIEPTSLAFQARLLTIIPPRLPDVTTLPMPTCVRLLA